MEELECVDNEFGYFFIIQLVFNETYQKKIHPKYIYGKQVECDEIDLHGKIYEYLLEFKHNIPYLSRIRVTKRIFKLKQGSTDMSIPYSKLQEYHFEILNASERFKGIKQWELYFKDVLSNIKSKSH